MKLIIEFQYPGVTERELCILLMDALYEFQHRGPVQRINARQYVNHRYPDTPAYSWLNREEKIKQVERRCSIAEQLRCAEFSFEE